VHHSINGLGDVRPSDLEIGKVFLLYLHYRGVGRSYDESNELLSIRGVSILTSLQPAFLDDVFDRTPEM
jgi:hypothetical protein